jgi:hypothetical protein
MLSWKVEGTAGRGRRGKLLLDELKGNGRRSHTLCRALALEEAMNKGSFAFLLAQQSAAVGCNDKQ